MSNRLEGLFTNEIEELAICMLEILGFEGTEVDIPNGKEPAEYVYCHYCLKDAPIGEPDEHLMYHPVIEHEDSCPFIRAWQIINEHKLFVEKYGSLFGIRLK
jgi:hypothetical protein